MSPPWPPARTEAEIVANRTYVLDRIAAAAQRSGRQPEEVRLLPVSKTVTPQRIRAAIAAGCREFGENKAQEAAAKSAELADTGVRWSFIGHLQTNKVGLVAGFAAEFQALDRLEVAVALDRQLQRLGRQLPVLVQVNTSGEASKYGLESADVAGFLRELRGIDTLRVRGLMTLAALSDDAEVTRSCFARLRTLCDGLRADGFDDVRELSMGMSGDYEIAVQEGSTVVRVGQAIFGARPTPDTEYWPST